MLKLDQAISFKNAKELATAILWLQSHGYENVQHITKENYTFPVLVVRGDCFFGTNTTCMAAMATKGYRAISWKTWLENR